MTLRQPDGSDRLTGSLEAPGAPVVTLLAERDGETLLLTRTVAGQTPERFTSSPAEVSSLEARVLAALGPAAPTAVARASHKLVGLPARAAYPTAPPGHFAQASRILPNQTRPEPTLAASVLLDNSQPIRKTTRAAPRATPGGGAAS